MSKRKSDTNRSAASFLEAHREGPTGEVYGIGELSKELNLTHRAIRFYESKGLISPGRVGSTRVYGRRERARLQLILRAKGLGMSLNDIKEYLDLYGEHGEGRHQQLEHVIDRTTEAIVELEAQRERIDKTLEELRMIQQESRHKLQELHESDS